MFPNRGWLTVVPVVLLSVGALFAGMPRGALAASYGVNLLVNGNAESGPASSTADHVTVPFWTVTGGFTVVPYGAPDGFPSPSQGPPDGGNQFFAGGNADLSTALQDINVAANAADIDAGTVVCDFSAWLGGTTNEEDQATMTVFFADAQGQQLGNSAIGPVTASDRASETKLLLRAGSVAVPPKTRSIRAGVTMQRIGGDAHNNGYADNLLVTLRGPALVTITADSGAGSLRDAIPKGSVITFDPTVFGEPHGSQTIKLLSALPPLAGVQSIHGPGAKVLTVRRSSDAGAAKFRIFTVGNSAGGAASSVNVSGLTIAGGDISGGGAGGGIFVSYSNLLLQGCVLDGNKADTYGALWGFNSSIVLDGCTISNNSAGAVGAIGNEAAGGNSTMVISNCTISANTTSDLTKSPEVLRNQSDAFPDSTAMMDVESATISGNTGGFLQVSSGGPAKVILHLQNTIIASTGLNFPPGGAGGTYVSHGYNLSNHDDSLILNSSGDRNRSEPKLGKLQDNGGSTPTLALLPGSPAIDKGNTGLETDQRGYPRPVDDPASVDGGGNKADIGAYEFAPIAIGNISTRARVEFGDNILIAGFVVTGTQDKKVIVRGIGPSLPFDGRLDNPTLELRDVNGALVSSNDDWVNSPDKQAIIATGLAPANDQESAILMTLPANGSSYTAIVRGVGGGIGIAVVEVYDLDQAADSRLANISTRGFVSTGDDVMIAGTIVVGPAPQRAIIRAIGPSLTLADKLADPTLELFDANGHLVAENDNWEDSPNKQTIMDSGLAPSDSHESAILATLLPGAGYTAIVQGSGNSTSDPNDSGPRVTRTQAGSGTTLEIQHIQFAHAPSGGSYQLKFTRPASIISGQPGDKAALEDTITIPGNANADEIKAAIMASEKFYKYDQNNNLTAGPFPFHFLFDSGGGLGIEGNEGSLREVFVEGDATDFTIQFGKLTTGNVGTRNPWVRQLPLVEVIPNNVGIAVVEIYALP
jgi:hypothetical protein